MYWFGDRHDGIYCHIPWQVLDNYLGSLKVPMYRHDFRTLSSVRDIPIVSHVRIYELCSIIRRFVSSARDACVAINYNVIMNILAVKLTLYTR